MSINLTNICTIYTIFGSDKKEFSTFLLAFHEDIKLLIYFKFIFFQTETPKS